MLPSRNAAIFDQYPAQVFDGTRVRAHASRSRSKGCCCCRRRLAVSPRAPGEWKNGKDDDSLSSGGRTRIKRTRIPTGWLEPDVDGGGEQRGRQRDSSYLRNLRESGLNTVTRSNRFLCRAICPCEILRIIVANLVIVARERT